MRHVCNSTRAFTSFFTHTFFFFNDSYKLSVTGFPLNSFNTLCCYSFTFFTVKYLFINVIDEFLYCKRQKSSNFLFLKYNTFLARYFVPALTAVCTFTLLCIIHLTYKSLYLKMLSLLTTTRTTLMYHVNAL